MKAFGQPPGWREKVYKYMRIYLWSALRIMVLRMRVLRKRDLIADLRCLLTHQEDGGQVLVWPSGLRSRSGCFGGVGKGKNEELVENGSCSHYFLLSMAK